MFGRVLTCRIANDNGRSSEFIRKRTYPDKSRCYECGQLGDHLSYQCPKNVLGPREPPKPSKKKRRKIRRDGQKQDQESHSQSLEVSGSEGDGDNDQDEEFMDMSLSSAIKEEVSFFHLNFLASKFLRNFSIFLAK